MLNFFSLWGVGLSGIVFAGVCLVSQRGSLFGILLSLEVFTVGLYMMILGVWGSYWSMGGLCLIFLTFGVCEAALGLSVLVSLMRSNGNDYVSGFTSSNF
uniref:NADH-ubiquinone oxidoreductase chain 4L n=1 Tax=Neotrigonia margaritacea TaxID=47539 RepID=A0A1X9JND2_9BIVA|nr:NADH dehydrogenase subunit 4L [Neotrigonia margaritacea]AQT38495.1 NADH dehydrogenase subunit 4L [Neotrigonia margaritacea]